MQLCMRTGILTAIAVIGIGALGLTVTQDAARAETTKTHTVSHYRAAYARTLDYDPANPYVYYSKSVTVMQLGTGADRVSQFTFYEVEYDYSSFPYTYNYRLSTGTVPNADLKINSANASLTVDTTEEGFRNFGYGDWSGWSGGEFDVEISKVKGGETTHDPYKLEFEYTYGDTTYSYSYHVNAKQDEAECDITLDGDDLFEDGPDDCAITRTNTGMMTIIETED